MSVTNQIGEISVKEDREVEWAIKDFFSYTAEVEPYASPSFDASGTRWYLQIYPNGQAKNDTVGMIGLYLHRELDESTTRGVVFTFGVKRGDGTVEKTRTDCAWVFDGKTKGYGRANLLERSELLKRKSEMGPSDTLTVICSLRLSTDMDIGLNTLSQNFRDMFISKKGCDATLKVGKEEFSVHKCILAARSRAFASIFDLEKKSEEKKKLEAGEKKKSKTEEKKKKKQRVTYIDIPHDFDPEAFRDFLVFQYTGKAENLPKNSFELYKIAETYIVKELMSACLISILNNLSLENVLEAAVLGHQFSIQALQFKTREFFRDNFKQIVSTPRWESLFRSNNDLANELIKHMASEAKSEGPSATNEKQ